MTPHTAITNQKTSGACNTEGDTTNDLNFATGTRHSKAVATQIAKLAMAGHAVHQLSDGGYLVANTDTPFTHVTLKPCKPSQEDWVCPNE